MSYASEGVPSSTEFILPHPKLSYHLTPPQLLPEAGLGGGDTKEKEKGERRRKGEKERKRIDPSRRKEVIGAFFHHGGWKSSCQRIEGVRRVYMPCWEGGRYSTL